ncbi:hypothetical protein Clacol_008865 [Clathrus columnatus]|uniref:Uncharacterized protein n=1 Tax=Clathrus columnatus TaxID=1419009 RepID=A0AAV5AN82_9AGAM|nr:hypothetical protein Clacol_008865 [Clathrus columnatus]
MFFDLNIPLPTPALLSNYASQNKQKQSIEPLCLFSGVQIKALETRIDLLVHLGYTVVALSQLCHSKVDGKHHIDYVSGLIPKLKKWHNLRLLKRLTVVLDEASEKGNGLTSQNTNILSSYDILSVRPFTSSTFSAACLTHSLPSQTTSHIISIPVSHSSRLPYYLKHTLIRTALSNGAVFEIDYAGALSSDDSERKFWWAGVREVIRVIKGKGLLLSGGIENDKDARAPRDAANLIGLAGLAQNLSHDAISQTAKTTVLRGQSRKTYRSILSEPVLIMPPVVSDSTRIPPMGFPGTVSEEDPKLSGKTLEVALSTMQTLQQAAQSEQIESSPMSLLSDKNQNSRGTKMDQTQTGLQSSRQFSESQTLLQAQYQPQKHHQSGPSGAFLDPKPTGDSASISSGNDPNPVKKRPRADSNQHNKAKCAASLIPISGNSSFSERQLKKRKKKR